MKLSEVVPWGRSLAEYQLLFNLSEAELDLRILGCGDGPASFNSEMTAAGRRVISIDPIYAFSKEQIRQRVAETYEPIISQVKLTHSVMYGTTFVIPTLWGRPGWRRWSDSWRILRQV